MIESKHIILNESEIKKCMADYLGVSEFDLELNASVERDYGTRDISLTVSSNKDFSELTEFLQD